LGRKKDVKPKKIQELSPPLTADGIPRYMSVSARVLDFCVLVDGMRVLCVRRKSPSWGKNKTILMVMVHVFQWAVAESMCNGYRYSPREKIVIW